MYGHLRSAGDLKHLLIVALNGSSAIQFDQHIDHSANVVTYLTDQTRAKTVSAYRERVADMVVINDPTDIDGEVFRAAGELFRRVGPANAVFTPSEHDLLTAAQIRDKFGIAGMTVSQTLDFRDKVCMKRRVHAGGVVTPRFSECGSKDETMDLITEVGYPIVLKPRRGMGSRGIHVVTNDAELARAWVLIDPEIYEAEEFISGPIYHVDGLVHQNDLIFNLPSKYVNTCLDTAHNRVPLGSIVVDDDNLKRMLRDFARASLTALSLENSAFHLEIILRDGKEPVFLEVGARAGGGQIRMVAEDVYGVDLIRQWVNLQLGDYPDLPSGDHPVGGWLVVPAPCEPPYQVMDLDPLSGRIPHLYHEALPRRGDVYDQARLRQDRWPGGRFRYSGPSSVAVEQAIIESIQRYRLKAVRLEDTCAVSGARGVVE